MLVSCLVTAMVMVSITQAQDQAPVREQILGGGGGGFQPGAAVGDYLYLPAYQILSSSQVQKEVNITAEQVGKLKEIAKKKIKTIKKMMNTPKSRNTCFNMVTKKDS